ncbi:3967_t:CDS:2 [Paraglomus occultum]|uniref:3967_t:CDS:1 n=1 Tax=Paraglomus occultum TaxID=144539 RepID=A0A9N9APN1_9GLOM|nr:3967_t:CDS:2 [Paraglomus occultum]
MVSKYYYHGSNDAADYLSKEQPVVITNQSSRSIGMHRRAALNVTARFSLTATTIGQDLYLIGGQTAADPTKNPIADNILHVDYSLNVDEENTKLAVQGHGAATVGSKILIFYGQQSLTPQVFAAPIQQIDPTTGVVSNFPNKGNIPASRFDHTVTVVNKKAYIIGGSTPKGVLKDVSYFDLTTSTWHTLDATKFPDNAAISGHATIAVNNLLISCFGIDNKNALRSDCIIFDTDKNDFVQAIISGTTPPPRSDATMVIGNSTAEILVFGGMDVRNKAAFNDMYILNASGAPTLTWQQVKVNAKNNTFIPSPRGGHVATSLGNNTVMMVWGGIGQGRNMADSSMYFFDLTNMQWVGESDAQNLISGLGSPNTTTNTTNTTNGSTDNTGSHDESSGAIIAAVLGTIVAIALLIFYMVRRRRLRKTASFDRAVNNDPYIRPGGQLNESLSDLSLNENAGWYAGHSDEPVTVMTDNNMEFKDPQPYADSMRRPSTTSVESEKQMIMHAQEMSNSLPPMPTVMPATVPKPDSLPPMPSIGSDSQYYTPENTEASSPNPLSMPTPPYVPYNPPSPSPKPVTSNRSSDSSHSKKGHRRTSSVSLTAADLAHHMFPKPPLRNSVSSTRSYGSQRPFHRSRSSLSQVFSPDADEPDYELSSNHSKKPSTAASDVVHAIGSPTLPSSPLSYDKELNNLSVQHDEMDVSPIDPEFAKIINGSDTIESTRHSNDGGSLDHKEIVASYDGQRRDNEPFQFPPRNSTSEPSDDASEQDHIYHERTLSYDRLQTIRESDVLDSYAREPFNGAEVVGDSSISSEEKKKLSKKKKRSSGRVSFATVHEKIEFDETESSRSVSLANSMVSAIPEDGINGDGNLEHYEEPKHENITNSKDSNTDIRPLRLYEDDENGANSDSRISRFSFSVYDFTTNDPMPSNAAAIIANVQAKKADEYRPSSPVQRKPSPDIRNSIAEVAIDGGVLYALI